MFWPGSPLSGQDLKKYHVAVLLPSENSVAPSASALEAAIESAAINRDALFSQEYLGAARFENSSLEESVTQYLRSKYASRKVDAVLAVGFGALSFAVRHGAGIFGGAPVVFAGVEQSRLDGLHLPPGFTGVTHFDDVRGTVEVALQLQPDTTEVTVLAGSEHDQFWLQHDRLIFDRLPLRVHFRYLTGLPMLAILRELNHLKPHTIVFVHALSRDVAGENVSGSEMLDLVSKSANAPLFGFTARSGFVGGRSTEEDDRRFPMAIEIVRRVLSGEKAASIPIQQSKPKYPYVFDAQQLQRWKIDPDRVPPGSLLLNREPSFWQLHRQLVLGVSSFIGLESALIAFLLIQRRRRKKAEALLEDRNARLRESEHSLRRLSGQLIDAQEEERTRIARELHDDLNQQVADLGISLSNIKRGIPASSEMRGELASVQSRLAALSDGLRHISHELHPGMLELFGLGPALKSHCEEFSAVTSIPVAFENHCEDSVAPDVALCLYRIAQESLRNAAKHARPTQARVSLTKSGNVLRLMVSDDGAGFEVEKAYAKGGLGLRSMEERIWLVHGHLELTSQPGSGTTLLATVEVSASHEAAEPFRTHAQA